MRHVEGRDRLVEDEQLRLEGERPGDPDALALAAGELVRIPVAVLGVRARPARAGSATRSRPAVAGTDRGSAAARPRSRSTGMRGFSEAYGSWNTTCRSRRTPAELALVDRGQVGAGRTAPRRWSATVSRRRPVPSSTCRTPTRRPGPGSRPGRGRSDTSDTACTAPRCPATSAPAPDREVLHQIAHREDRRRSGPPSRAAAGATGRDRVPVLTAVAPRGA